jgi:hypothetical protein
MPIIAEVLTLLQIDEDKLGWTGQLIDGVDKIPMNDIVPYYPKKSRVVRAIREQVSIKRQAYIESKGPQPPTTLILDEQGIFKDTLS